MASVKQSLDEHIFECFNSAIPKAIRDAVNTASGWGAHKSMGGMYWATYKATVRRQGVYSGASGPRDFNQELFDPISRDLATGKKMHPISLLYVDSLNNYRLGKGIPAPPSSYPRSFRLELQGSAFEIPPVSCGAGSATTHQCDGCHDVVSADHEPYPNAQRVAWHTKSYHHRFAARS